MWYMYKYHIMCMWLLCIVSGPLYPLNCSALHCCLCTQRADHAVRQLYCTGTCTKIPFTSKHEVIIYFRCAGVVWGAAHT